MNTIEAICSRRSVRKYNNQTIPNELILEIITAAMFAPSAFNEQPWQFIIINDKNLLNKIPLFSPHAHMCKNSTVSILICCDKTLEKTSDFWIQDCSAATQNLLLAAHDKGIGSVWSGVYPREPIMEGFKKLLNLPQELIPFSFIILGYPEEKIEPQDRLKKDRIHYNCFKK
jgi:nitroreductase